MTNIRLDNQVIPVQRIFCIGRNYAGHARELGNAVPEEPVVFMKPPASLVPVGQAVMLPRGRGAVHHEAELVVALGDGGTITGVTLGLDLTLRDMQNSLKQAGKPWELAKAFEHSAPLGGFVPAMSPQVLAALTFNCHVNGELRQQGDTRDMLFPVPVLIDYLRRYWDLRAGDIVFTGTPSGVGPLAAGDTVILESPAIGRFNWRFV